MKFVIVIRGREIPVEITRTDGDYRLTLEGKSRTVNAIRPDPQTLSLLIDGKSYEVGVEKKGSAYWLHFFNDTVQLEIFEARKFKAKAVTRKSSQTGPVKVVSPMPGKIIRIAIAENAEVSEGESLIIMEAMKMQNELKAPRAGVVKQIQVKEGEPVLPMQTLVILE